MSPPHLYNRDPEDAELSPTTRGGAEVLQAALVAVASAASGFTDTVTLQYQRPRSLGLTTEWRSPSRVCTQSRVVCTPTQAPPLAAHCNCYNTPVEVIHWTSHHCTPNIVMTAARAQYGIPQPPIPSTTQCSCYWSWCRDSTTHSQGNRSCCSQVHECGRLRWQHQRGGPRPYHSSYPTQPPWPRCHHYQPLHHSYQNHHDRWSNHWSNHLTAARCEHVCSEMALEPTEPSTHS